MRKENPIEGRRCVIYGAGGGGRAFLALNRQNIRAVAFADRSEGLQRSRIDGLEVVAPNDIGALEYDYVVIASMWVGEIRSTLHELGIGDERIVVPPKNQLKNGLPFQDASTKNLAEDSVVAITDFLYHAGVTAFVDFGTLLGLAREGGILQWDDDVDMSVNASEFEAARACWEEVRSHLPDARGARWTSTWIHDCGGRSLGISLDLTDIDESPFNAFGIYVRCRHIEGPWSIPTGAIGNVEIPSKHFSSAEVLPVFGRRVFAPFEYEGYLSLVYGDWNSPRPALSFDDYPRFDQRSYAGVDANSISRSPIF